MTLEQLETKVKNLEKKLCCLITCECEDPQVSCEYDSSVSWTEQTEGIQYTIVVSYIEPSTNINVQLLNIASTTIQTPQEFLDLLNATYGPSMTFSLNEDGTVHLIAEGFAAACFLQLINSQQAPNTTTSWESPNSVQFNVLEIISSDSHSQGFYNGGSWGGDTPPTTSAGYLPFDGSTEKIIISYNASIPSALSVCVHLIQNGNEIWSSPFNLNIPASGLGTTELTGLTGLLDSSYDLTILINNDC